MGHLWDDAVDGGGGWDGWMYCTVPSMRWNAAAGGRSGAKVESGGEESTFW